MAEIKAFAVEVRSYFKTLRRLLELVAKHDPLETHKEKVIRHSKSLETAIEEFVRGSPELLSSVSEQFTEIFREKRSAILRGEDSWIAGRKPLILGKSKIDIAWYYAQALRIRDELEQAAEGVGTSKAMEVDLEYPTFLKLHFCRIFAANTPDQKEKLISVINPLEVRLKIQTAPSLPTGVVDNALDAACSLIPGANKDSLKKAFTDIVDQDFMRDIFSNLQQTGDINGVFQSIASRVRDKNPQLVEQSPEIMESFDNVATGKSKITDLLSLGGGGDGVKSEPKKESKKDLIEDLMSGT